MRLPTLGRDGRYQLEAKTAYGLLSTIKAIVKSDARTMRMRNWGGRPGNAINFPAESKPACGTIGCIGGWIEHLTGDHALRAASRALGFGVSGYPRSSADNKAIDGFFFGDACGDVNQGTPAHARKVLRLITRFQRTHRRRLLATKVVVTR